MNNKKVNSMFTIRFLNLRGDKEKLLIGIFQKDSELEYPYAPLKNSKFSPLELVENLDSAKLELYEYLSNIGGNNVYPFENLTIHRMKIREKFEQFPFLVCYLVMD